ncbi:MAG: GAF domain-containing protein [Deltaproteobacteria bacterium]|jgi:adenylate cyclase|nr:GAF domain-containing protein [Deltaproteobacteria bacterium]
MATLYVTTTDGRISSYPLLRQETTIGRSKDNDLVLLDHTVSRKHAKITKTDQGHLLLDLGSFNGTVVNETLIQSALLKDEDIIKIGLNTLTYVSRSRTGKLFKGTLTLSGGTDLGKEPEPFIKASSETFSPMASQVLLVSKEPAESRKAMAFKKESEVPEFKRELSALERTNKVLYVLYEISRQLNSIHDFGELLNKIMDLIFVVIDADHGFLILTGERDREELIPVVVKSREDQPAEQESLKASRTIINRVIRDGVALLTSNAMTDSRLDHAKSLLLQQIRSAICVPLWRKDKIIGVIQLESVRLDNQFAQEDLELLKAIGSQMAMVIEQASLNEQIREEERIRNRLERFHSPQVIDMILKGGQETLDDMMEPKDATATVLFADINGFTALAERMPPREVNLILNDFFSRMTDILFHYDGTLDKYIGDGLMAVFGAPMEKEDDAERAIRAAQEMTQALGAMMAGMPDERKFSIRIGINTGKVVAGNIGSPKRMDYTVIGDAVNTASRLESIAKPNQILIGEETYERVQGKFNIRSVGPRKVKGKTLEVMVYEVL